MKANRIFKLNKLETRSIAFIWEKYAAVLYASNTFVAKSNFSENEFSDFEEFPSHHFAHRIKSVRRLTISRPTHLTLW